MPRGRTLTLSLPPFTKAVKWIMLANAGVFLLTTLLSALNPGVAAVLSYSFSLVPSLVLHGWLWQLVTYSFLHAGFWHILLNMLWLWWFGTQLEMEWGTRKFVEFYLFCVVGAALVTIAVSYTGWGGISPNTSTEGASGGVLGILAAFGVLFGNQEIMLFPIPFSIKAKYFVMGVAFFTLIDAINAAGPGHGSNIAYAAHLGGLLFGFLYVKLIPKKGIGFNASERFFGIRNDYYRWKRRRAARKFEVYMRDKHNRTVEFDEQGNYIPPDEEKKNGGSKSGWVN
jgi:membrane associated rhomboid family serine protease